MYCPKCGTENPDDAQSCRSCNWDLTSASPHTPSPHAKTSGLVIAGIAILAVALLIFSWPRISRPPRYAPKVKQKAQFHGIEVALEFFNSEWGSYPPSDPLDEDNKHYCGAMKLCEAMIGQDLQGFHPDSVFRADGTDATGTRKLYPESPEPNNLKARKGPYLQPETANAYRLDELYSNTEPFDPNGLVLCDVYSRVTHRGTGRRVGMPIIYYKADTSKTAHNLDNPDDPNNIYNYKDNLALLGLGVPWDPNEKHPLFTNPKIFYEMTKNRKVKTQSILHQAESFILISAGYDGLYGTKDDIVNFEMRWKPK